ncbi:MAG: hypothetical protein WA880_02325 [Ornithinimicrobium sp.]
MRSESVTSGPGVHAEHQAHVGSYASWRQDAVTLAAGALLVAALFSDGWAHANVPELEGFFTAWHGALYTGFVVNAAWIAWLAWSGGTEDRRLGLPVGYGWGAVGVGIFAVGGLADMVWHLILGVEVGVDALLSPSHLVLLTGGMLILTSALRSRWAVGDLSSIVAQGSLALATALAAFFLLYTSEFAGAAPTVPYLRLPEGDPGHEAGELPALVGLGSFLVTTAVLMIPLLFVWQRGRAPRGLITVVVVTVAWLSAAVVDFPVAVLAGAIGATVGALAADGFVQLLEGRTWNRPGARLSALAAVASGSVWTAHMVALAVTSGLEWPPELWAGALVLSSMAAAALGGLAAGASPALWQRPAQLAGCLCSDRDSCIGGGPCGGRVVHPTRHPAPDSVGRIDV